MASITKISSEAAIASVNAVVSLLDIGGAGRVDIMSGTQPDNVNIPITTQTVVASLTLSPTAFQEAVDMGGFARATANDVFEDLSANNSGTATWFRAYNGAGNAIIDGNVGVTDEALIVSKINIAFNDTVNIISWNFGQNE